MYRPERIPLGSVGESSGVRDSGICFRLRSSCIAMIDRHPIRRGSVACISSPPLPSSSDDARNFSIVIRRGRPLLGDMDRDQKASISRRQRLAGQGKANRPRSGIPSCTQRERENLRLLGDRNKFRPSRGHVGARSICAFRASDVFRAARKRTAGRRDREGGPPQRGTRGGGREGRRDWHPAKRAAALSATPTPVNAIRRPDLNYAACRSSGAR